jgi:hypothetical protein
MKVRNISEDLQGVQSQYVGWLRLSRQQYMCSTANAATSISATSNFAGKHGMQIARLLSGTARCCASEAKSEGAAPLEIVQSYAVPPNLVVGASSLH